MRIATPLAYLVVWALGCALDPYVPECDSGERLEQGAHDLHCVPDTEVDNDADGYERFEDCDDDDPDVNPEAVERCDGLDNNCDEEVDEGCDTG